MVAADVYVRLPDGPEPTHDRSARQPVTDSERVILGHAIGLFEALGKKPSVRSVAAVIEAAHGKRAMRWQTIAEALKVLPGNTSGNTPATVGQQFYEERATPRQQSESATHERADLSRVVYDSAQGEDTNPLPPTPLPAKTTVAEPPALFAVSDVPAKPAKLTVAAQDPDTDFGPFEADVVAMIAVEKSRHPRTKIEPAVVRQRLALLWRKHGDAAFARGLEVGVSSGNGVNYGRAVMERYDPERDRAPLRSVDGGRNDDDGMPLGCEVETADDYKPGPAMPWDRRPAGLGQPAAMA